MMAGRACSLQPRQQTLDSIERSHIGQTPLQRKRTFQFHFGAYVCPAVKLLRCYSVLPMIIDALHRIATHRQSLSREEARSVMAQVLAGKCSDAQIAALLVALHMKGETVEEIVGFAEAIRAAATPLPIATEGSANNSGPLALTGTGRDALAQSS